MPSADPPVSRHDAKVMASRHVADLLRTEILSGAFHLGSALPSEAELMCAYRASRNVVRAALDLLRHDGYVTRLQGRGTLVVSRRVVHDFGPDRGIGMDSPGGGQRVTTRFLSIATEVASSTVATRLKMERGSRCVVVDYEVSVDRLPYAVGTSYLFGTAVEGAFEKDLEGDWYGDWTDVLASLGLSTGRLEVQVEVTTADESVADLLSVPLTTPLLRFERLLHDVDGDPIDFGYMRCRADRMVLRADSRELPGS